MDTTIEVARSDLREICEALLDCKEPHCGDDYDLDRFECYHCCAKEYQFDGASPMSHSLDCPVRVAQDLLPTKKRS